MAYAALVSLAQTIDQILNSDQYSISVEEKQQIQSIHEHTIHLQAFLDDFPEKARSLEGRIRDVAYEAEDIVECFVLNQMRPSSGFNPPSHKGSKYTPYPDIFDYDLNIATEEIDWIAGEESLCFYSELMDEQVMNSFTIKEQHNFPAASSSKDVMIGFDDDLMAIKARLCGESSQLQVIPIVGMGGIGKTVLVKNAYDDPLIVNTFQIRCWIRVSQDHNPRIFFSKLLRHMERFNVNFWDLFPVNIEEQVNKILKRWKYLIVIDDMHSTKQWDDVRNAFPDDNNGSRIILTTRLLDVAVYPDPCSPPYEMHLMDENQSWNLLRHRAFADKDCPPQLKKIGKEIARGCRGFPVALVNSAGLLSTVSKNPALWEEIAENVNSVVAGFLSYVNLPYHLRSCILHLGSFPNDDEVCVSKLIESWIATIEKLMLEQYHPHWAQLVCHAHDLEKATENFESMSEQLMDIKNSFTIEELHQLGDSPTATSSSSELAPTHKDLMIGFDDDLMEIKHQLCGESSKLQVIPIFGMGGIGKTTLAKITYDDPLIMEHFHIRAWVTISQDYSVKEILSGLLVSMEGLNADISGQSNEEKVYKILKGRRYLIVMDDMWSTKAWDDVRNIFPNDGNGSRIMLTTRLSYVASYPDLCSSTYEMHFMNESQSWDLLHQKVFGQQDCPPELESIGKKIARSCRGLPLAIVVVAGLLSTISKNPASWEEIAENVNSVVGKDGQCEEILSLSYSHLPHHLRPCFLYLGGFPEDHEIRVSKLIKLWVAEGFLKRSNGSKSLEEEAEECLENLVKRSLVLVTKRKSNGRIKSCSLHDLMRDLCIRKANEERFLANIRDGHVVRGILNQRRMSIAFAGSSYLFTYGPTIHTLMWFLYTSLPSLESLRLLRVLDAGDADVESLPVELFELFYLSFFAINYSGRIPAAISKLQNLQTLIIRARGRWKLEANHKDCLPQEIWRMPQLRHLLFYGTLPDPEGTISTLEKLQTLLFSLSHHTAEGILKMTPHLKKLKVSCYDRRGRAST